MFIRNSKKHNMSDGLQILAATEDDISKLLMAKVHLGGKNCNHQMLKYVFKRRSDGVHIINIHKTWEKILLAARAVVATEDPSQVVAISSPTIGQRAVLKFAKHTGASPLAGRFTPGTFTNQIQKAFMEPRLLIVTDPLADHQPIREASYVNIPTIGLADTDTPLRYLDLVIPTNNKAVHSVGTIWWMLAREVQRFRGTLSRQTPWEIMTDLYFYRDPEEIEKEEQAKQEEAQLGDKQFQQWGTEGEAPVEPVTEDVVAPVDPAFAAQMPPAQEWGSTSAEWGSSTPGWDAAQ